MNNLHKLADYDNPIVIDKAVEPSGDVWSCSKCTAWYRRGEEKQESALRNDPPSAGGRWRAALRPREAVGAHAHTRSSDGCVYKIFNKSASAAPALAVV